MKAITEITICLVLLLQCEAFAGSVSPGLSERLGEASPDTMLPVIVRMAKKADLPGEKALLVRGKRALRLQQAIETLKNRALEDQTALVALIEREKTLGRVESYTPRWIFNGFALRATPEVIKKIALRDDVEMVGEDFVIPLPSFSAAIPLQTNACDGWNIERIRAPEVWERGYDGSGVVVAIIDTGVDVTHPDLQDSFRGGDNSWFDPHGEHAFPVDAAGSATGHGTHVAGIVVGGDSSGLPIGVAPGARWIAAKLWNDGGDPVFSSDVHAIFEWVMDPDGDPATDDAPHVVNCSWGFSLLDTIPWCLPDLRDDVQAWREAGIIPVFSAGNAGPWLLTGTSPANYPEAIAVGASNLLDTVAFFSSRGPGNCDLSIFPAMVAPGVNVCSSAPGGRYHYVSGTSQAAPHVTGTIALMLSADPGLTLEEIESRLKVTAKPVGWLRPTFASGWGRLDALQAVRAVIP